MNFDRLREYRRRRLSEAMKASGLDGVVAFRAENVRYISSLRPLIWEAGYQTRNMVVADKDGNVSLFVASGDYQRTKANCPWLSTVLPLASLEDSGVARRVVREHLLPELKKMGLIGGRIGMDTTTFYTTEFIKNVLADNGTDLIDGDETLKQARAIKSQDELRLIQIAAAMVDAGINEAKKHLVAGATENEIAGSALERMYSLGTEWMPVNPVVFAGIGPYRGYATDNVVSYRGNVVVDLSAMHDGYCAQASRTFAVGPDTGEGPKFRRSVGALYEGVAKELKPGASLRKLVSALRARCRHDGIRDCQVEVRGTGLALTDLPRWQNTDGDDTVLEKGMSLVFRLRAQKNGLGTVQLSDSFHIDDRGGVPFTKFQGGSR